MISSLSPPREKNLWDNEGRKRPTLKGEIDIKEIY